MIPCLTRCNACGGYWIKEPQSVTLTQIANACSRHEQQFTEQQQNKHVKSGLIAIYNEGKK